MKTYDNYELTVRPRKTESVTITVPLEALESLRRVAGIRDMSEQALLKFYIGQGLRQDLSKLYSDRVLETAAEVLARHLHSDQEVSQILDEIRIASFG
jgi:hypothetical protein